MENKQRICDLLCEALKATRAGVDIAAITYDLRSESVFVYFGDDEKPSRQINVAMDSGIAMIRDIMRHIDIG